MSEKLPSREVLIDAVEPDGTLNLAKFLAREVGVLEPADLMASVQLICKTPLKAVKFDGVETVGEIRPDHFLRYIPVTANVLSCHKVWEVSDKVTRPSFYYAGVCEVGEDRFRFVSRVRVPQGRRRMVVFPTVEEGGRKPRPVLKVLGFEDEQRFDTDWRPSGPQDVRACFPTLVGEDVNAMLLVLALASRLNLNRDFWVMGLVLQGESSSGKSYLANQVLRPFTLLGRVEEFTRFTGPYLERKFKGRNMDEVILLIYELGDNTPQQLHLTLSEGRLRVGLVDRETGEAIEYDFEGMPFLLSTTPLESLRPDLRNRVIVTAIDESEEQTKKILKFETELAADGMAAKKLRDEAEALARRFAGFFQSLRPAAVVVPWAEKLYERLTFYETKLRRDWKKLFALLQASALLFQHDRKVEERDGVRVVYADRRDLENLLYVMPAFTQTLRNVTEAQKRMLDILEGTFEATARELVEKALKTGWKVSARRVRAILEELEALGYVVISRAGRENRYTKVRGYNEIDFSPLLEVVGESEPIRLNNVEHAEQPGSGGCSELVSPPQAVESQNSGESADLEHANPTQTGTSLRNPQISITCLGGAHGECSGAFKALIPDFKNRSNTTEQLTCLCPCHRGGEE